jgi:5-formyltetrahydrofolate cyclo-ligase
MNKAALRNKHKDLRLNVDPVYLEAASLRLQVKAWEIIKDVSSVGLYISMDYEVSTRALLQSCLENHKIVCVPKIVGHEMIFIQINDLSECSKSPYGILEPSSNEAYKGKIDVQIIPMLAFNQRKYRLGYGKGYYDAYLKNYTGLKFGLCFSMDEEPDLSEDPYDIACDMILTEIK